MTEIKTSHHILAALRADETPQWAGKAEYFPLLNSDNKKSFLLRWIICGGLAVLCTVGYIIAVMNTETKFNVILELIILLLFGYTALMPVLDRRKILKKCHYCITNQRAIVAAGDNDIFSLNRKAVKIQAVPAEDGCITILMGAMADTPAKKHRTATFVPPKSDGDNEVIGLVFYNVKDDSLLRSLLDI